MSAYSLITDNSRPRPKVMVIGLASCFGCQLQITNNEPHLVELLDQIDLQYWQLVSSETLPDDYDVAIIEGAVSTQESAELLKKVRAQAKHVMAIGACAVTGGIPGLAHDELSESVSQVYGGELPEACGTAIAPRPVSDVIEVDSFVRCCPIDPSDFVKELQRVLFGSNATQSQRTICADCKRNETECFYDQGKLCMGLVTRSGCGARCVNLGRECMGCAGLSPVANVEAARMACERYDISVDSFDAALRVFNQVQIAKEAASDNEESR